ncbi:leiomodin-1 [Lissotriton helveticus]
MSRVAKYRRQVSEDPDIDSLLSTLSPEEMEELEKELDNGEPDSRLAMGLRQRNEADKAAASSKEAAPKQGEKDTKSRLKKEQSVEDGKKTDSKKDAKHIEERNKEPRPRDFDRKQKADVGIEAKKAELGTKSSIKEKQERFSKLQDKPKEKIGEVTERGRLNKTWDKTPTEDKHMAKTENEKQSDRKGAEDKLQKTANKTEKPAEKRDLLESRTKVTDKNNLKTVNDKENAKKDINDKNIEEKPQPLKVDEKDTGKKKSAEPTKDSTDKTKASASEILKTMPNETGEASPVEIVVDNLTDQNKEDEASSIFDEDLEKVKNNDPELTELNVNNSDCINIETLMSFTEALEFNTVVKVFALANTRADDHIALAIAAMLKSNQTLLSINLDSNHITGKGILAIFRALQHNNTLTELRFHNQRHICGGKTEMEIAKMLKENTTLLKLGYHFELAGPRMTVTNLLSRNMDKQRQKRMKEQKQKQAQAQAQEEVEKKTCLEVPKIVGLPKGSPKPSPQPSPKSSPYSSPKSTPKKGGVPVAPPPPPPPLAPLAPPLINENIRNSLSPATQRKLVDKVGPSEKNSRDQLLDAIRCSNIRKLKKVEVPKLLQ